MTQDISESAATIVAERLTAETKAAEIKIMDVMQHGVSLNETELATETAIPEAIASLAVMSLLYDGRLRLEPERTPTGLVRWLTRGSDCVSPAGVGFQISFVPPASLVSPFAVLDSDPGIPRPSPVPTLIGRSVLPQGHDEEHDEEYGVDEPERRS